MNTTSRMMELDRVNKLLDPICIPIKDEVKTQTRNVNKILVLDIETTGFLNGGGSIVEIGIASLCLDTGNVQIIYDSLLRESILTAKHRYKPYGWIFQNSDLSVEELRKAPPAAQVFEEVQAILNEYPLGCTAYNNKFDFDFLRNRGLSIISLPCPMLLSTNIVKLPSRRAGSKYKWPKAQEAYDYFYPNSGYIESHRAADDAYHEAFVVYELYKRKVFKI